MAESTPQEVEKALRQQIALFESQGLAKNAKPIRDKLIQHLAVHAPKSSLYAEKTLKNFLTEDADMLELKEQVHKLACEDDAVLIIGETGTGKEILAQALHGERKGIFVSMNCAGMPEDLIESELFGHVAGAFSSAHRDNIGLFMQAAEGTLFLDEVGDLKPGLQAKFLRAIQSKRIRPVGATMEKIVSCRIIAATHHNIPAQVEKGEFRLDLYARLSTIELVTKPLRSRRGDIKLIVNALDKTGRCYNEMEGLWTANEFPLNVRDIQRYVRRWQLFGMKGMK